MLDTVVMDFTAEDWLARYRRMLEDNPALGRNPPDAAIELLTAAAEIEAAQRAVQASRGTAGLDVSDLRVGLLAADPYLTLLRDAVRFADGSYGLYNRVVEGPAVAILPLCAGRPVLIRVFRHALRDWSIEFPRGGIETGESIEAAVRREIYEEIGARVIDCVDLGAFTPGGSTLAEISHLCFSHVDNIGSLDHAEGIAEAFAVAIDDLEEMIKTARITDGFSIALFARARLSGLI